MRPHARVEPTAAIAAALLVGIVVLGVALRLHDPLSTRAIGAEDPYSHIVFTKEALERGWFGDSFHLGTSLYPPGLHALMGALAPATVGFYAFTRLAPVAFGALAILGTYVLARRMAGEAAGLAAALLVAVMPEHIFRTTLMFPTALDLALLPAWLLAFHLATRPEGEPGPSRAAAGILFVAMAPALAFNHPWLVPLTTGPLALWLALRALRASPAPLRATWRRMALPAAALVVSTAFAMAFRWDESDTGFADFLSKLPGLAPLADLDLAPVALFALLLVALGAAFALGAGATAVAARAAWPRAVRVGASAVAAVSLVALAPVLASHPPLHVSYKDMLGWVAVGLGLAGVALALLRPSALGDLGLALAVVLFPLTAINFFDGEFWPQRTVAYLCVAVALLAGHVAHVAHGLASRATLRATTRHAAPVALVLVTLLLASAFAAARPAPYPWYRLYTDDQFEAFEETAAVLEEHPDARVFVARWESALMVKALGDPAQLWYSPEFFSSGGARDGQLGSVEGPAYVLVDHYTQRAAEKGKFDLGFLQSGYRVVLESDDGTVRLYEKEGRG